MIIAAWRDYNSVPGCRSHEAPIGVSAKPAAISDRRLTSKLTRGRPRVLPNCGPQIPVPGHRTSSEGSSQLSSWFLFSWSQKKNVKGHSGQEVQSFVTKPGSNIHCVCHRLFIRSQSRHPAHSQGKTLSWTQINRRNSKVSLS